MPGRPPTFDHMRKKPLERRVRIYLDDDPIEQLIAAREALTEALKDAPVDSDTAALQQAVAAAEEAVIAASQVFVLRSPEIERDGRPMRGRRAFEQLIAEHPPTEDDHDDTRRMTGRPEALARWHTDTFTPALLSACCVDPKLTVEQASEMYDEWTDGELGELVAAAFEVSQGTRQVDLGKASRAATTPA